MISWLITAIVDMVATAIILVLEAITNVFTEMMGLSTDGKTLQAMADIFPQAAEIYPAFVAGGFFICFTIAVFQLCKSMFGPLSEAESPVQLMVRTAFYTALIGLAVPICNGIIYIGAIPYEAMEEHFSLVNVVENNGTWDMGSISSHLSEDGASEEGSAALNTGAMVLAIMTMPGLFAFLVIIMFMQLLKKYCALLIEIVERYVVLGFLTLIAPLCIATGASRATNFVFKSWLQMMLSQVIIIFFSSFFLHTFNYAFGNWLHSFTGTASSTFGSAANNPFIYFFFLLAWLTVAAHVDEYMGQLGLTAAKTGGGMGADFMNNVGRSAGIANAATNKMLGTNYGKAGGFKNPLHEAMAGKAARAAHKAAGNNTGMRNLGAGLKAAAAKPGFAKAANQAAKNGEGLKGQLKAGIQGSKTAGFASVNKAHAGEEFMTKGGAKAALNNMMNSQNRCSSDNLGDIAKQAMGGENGALKGCKMDNDKCYASNGIAHLEGEKDGKHFAMDITDAKTQEGKNGMAIAGNKDYSYVGNKEGNEAPPEGVLDKNFKNNADEINKAEDKTATDGSLHKAGDVPNTDDNGGTFKGGEIMKDENGHDLVQGGFDKEGNFVQSADGKDPETGEQLSNFGVYAASVDDNGKLTAKDDNGNDLAQGGFNDKGEFVQAGSKEEADEKGLSDFGVHSVRDDGNGGLQAVDANGNDIVQGGFDGNGNFVQAANEKEAAEKGLSDFGMHSVNADGQAVDANGNTIVQGGFDGNGNFVQAANEKDAEAKGLDNFGQYAQKDGQIVDANEHQVAQGGFDANGNFVQAANEKDAEAKGLNDFGVHAVSKDSNGGLQAIDAHGNNIVQGGFNDKGEFVAAANKEAADKQGLSNFGMHAVAQGGFNDKGEFVAAANKEAADKQGLSNFGSHAVEDNGKGGLKAAGPDSTQATSAANLNISSTPITASIGNGITKDAAGNNFQDKNGNYVASSGGRLLSGAEQTNAHYGFAPGNSSQMERAVQNSDGKWVGATSGKELSGVIAAGGQGGAGSISVNPASAPNGNGINPMAVDSNGKVSAATYDAKSGNWTTNAGRNVVSANNVFAAAPGEMPKNGSQLVYSSGNGKFEAVTPTGNGQFKTQSGQTVSASQVSAISLGSNQAFCATDSSGKLQQVTQNSSGAYTFADGTKVTGPMQVGNETSKGNYQAAAASTVAMTVAPIATSSGSGAQYSHGGAAVFSNGNGGYSSTSLSDKTNYTSTQGAPTMYSPVTGNALTYNASTNTFSNGKESFAADAPLSTVGRGSICEVGGSGAGNPVYFQNDRNEGDAINCGGKMMSASAAIATKDGISIVSADGTTTSVGSTAQECYSNVPMRSITTSDGNSYDNVTPVRDSGGKITSYEASDNGNKVSISLDNIAGGSVAMYETQYAASGAKITLGDTRTIGGETYHNIAGTDSYIANSDLSRTGNTIDSFNNVSNTGSVNIGGHAVDAACTRYDENGQINASGSFYRDQNTGVLFQSDEAPTVRTEPIRIPIDESKISKGFVMCDADNATHVTTNGKVYEIENGQMVVGNSNGTKQYAPIADGAVYGSVCPQYNGIPCDNGCLILPPTASVTSGDGGTSANIDFNGQRITVNAPGAFAANGNNTVQSGNSTITFSSPVYDKCESYFESNNIPISKRFNDHEAQHIAGICHIPDAQNVKSLTRTSEGIVCTYNNNTAKRFYKTHTVDSVMKLDKEGNRHHTTINKQKYTDPLSLVKVCPEGYRG